MLSNFTSHICSTYLLRIIFSHISSYTKTVIDIPLKIMQTVAVIGNGDSKRSSKFVFVEVWNWNKIYSYCKYNVMYHVAITPLDWFVWNGKYKIPFESLKRINELFIAAILFNGSFCDTSEY